MQMALQITVRGMEHSSALDNHIRGRVERLDRVYPKLMGCRVVAELGDRHKHQGRHFSVRVDLTAPGKEIVVSRHHAEDIYVALRDAFDAAKRRLEEYAHIQRGEVKSHSAAPRPPGEVFE